MNERARERPEANIEVGSSKFNIWVGIQGIKKILIPGSSSAIEDGKPQKEFRVEPVRLELLCEVTEVEEQYLRLLNIFFTALFSGREPLKCPPYSLEGLSGFSKEVLCATARIPWGSTRSYSEVAKEIGRDRAARAVGSALGANPVPIIIPCHRVLRSNGELGGYSSGLFWKARLLSLESISP